jgi:hypothetical protein
VLHERLGEEEKTTQKEGDLNNNFILEAYPIFYKWVIKVERTKQESKVAQTNIMNQLHILNNGPKQLKRINVNQKLKNLWQDYKCLIPLLNSQNDDLIKNKLMSFKDMMSWKRIMKLETQGITS